MTRWAASEHLTSLPAGRQVAKNPKSDLVGRIVKVNQAVFKT